MANASRTRTSSPWHWLSYVYHPSLLPLSPSSQSNKRVMGAMVYVPLLSIWPINAETDSPTHRHGAPLQTAARHLEPHVTKHTPPFDVPWLVLLHTNMVISYLVPISLHLSLLSQLQPDVCVSDRRWQQHDVWPINMCTSLMVMGSSPTDNANPLTIQSQSKFCFPSSLP